MGNTVPVYKIALKRARNLPVQNRSSETTTTPAFFKDLLTFMGFYRSWPNQLFVALRSNLLAVVFRVAVVYGG